MFEDSGKKQAAKRSKLAGDQPRRGRGGQLPVRRWRVPIFELLELREMLSGNTYSPSTSVADSSTASDNNLRSAIAAANADTGSATDTIDLTSGTYNLSLGQLAVTSTAHTLIIEGQGSTGPNATVIDQTALDRVFQVDSGVTVIFENLKITGGRAVTDDSGGTDAAEGGGILNQGNLTLDNVAVIGNTAQATVPGEYAFGGGVFSIGPLTINGLTPGASLIEQNSAIGFAGVEGTNSGDAGYGEGGGIFSNTTGQLQVTGTAITNNSATGGAGPINTGAESDFAGLGVGGGILVAYDVGAPTALLDGDTIANNQAVGGNGGNGGTNQNGGSGGFGIGGGIAIEPQISGQIDVTIPLKISDSTISGNTAVGGAGGAVGTGGTSAGGSEGAFGGGVENGATGTELLNDTVYGNTAGGGSGYTAGGGINDDSSSMLIINVTVANNTAQASTGVVAYGGGIANTGGDSALMVENTLVANNTASDGPDVYGNVNSPDDDLINDASGSNFVSGAGIIVAPATLGIASSLANNGGNTQTLALSTGSAAIGAGDATAAKVEGLTNDQRGLPRTNAGGVDIGAYEVQPAAVTTTTTLNQSAGSASVGQNVTFTAVVNPAAGVTAAAAGTVQFEIDGVAFGSPVALGVVNGVDEATLSTSSLTAGAHVVTAIYSGDANFAASTSTVVNENIINPVATGTSITVSASPNPQALGLNVNFSAVVSAVGGGAAPVTGTVQFEVDGVVIGAGMLGNAPNLSTATFSTQSLGAGSHTVTAVYLGDTIFNGSVSAPLSPVTVTTTYGAPVVTGSTTTAENVPLSGLVITPAAADTTVTFFQITGITGGTLYYSGGAAQIVNGQFITVASGAAGLEFIPTAGSLANGSFTVQESTTANINGLVGTSTTTTISITGTKTVDLSSYYNLVGITNDGSGTGTGLDGAGNALSETQVGTSVTWNGITFSLASGNVNNVVQANGQTITLPAGNYANVTFLGVGTNGNQLNQQFIIHYSDGTSSTVSQSISDWAMPEGYAGESVALATAYRNISNGGRFTSTFDVYGYTLAVNPTKTVESITLPNDGNVKILSLATQATLDAPSNLTATPASNGDVALTWTASDSTVSGYNVYRYTFGGAGSPTLVGSAVSGTNFTDTTGVAGNTYYYVVKAINISAISPASNSASATVASSTTVTQVDLAGQYNLAGITADGSGFSGGLDGSGAALSETEVGTSLSWNGVSFTIAPAGANNVIQAQGQTISLPSGSYSEVELLATAVNGNQANETFTVKYTDGTSTTLTQSLSDWAMPQSYTGEAIVDATAYRNTSTGGRNSGTFNVYGYTIAVDSSKTIASITLPGDKNVDVLAIDTMAPVAAPAGLTVTTASSSESDLSWTAASGGTITGYNVYRSLTMGGTSTPINSSPLSASATSYADTTAMAGNTYYYVVKAINGPALSSPSNEASVTMPTAASSISVDLSSEYNLAGITVDGAHFSGGLDGQGNALSATAMGTSQTWNGVQFNIGPATSSPATNNVIQATGQTIGLPNGSYNQVEFLATTVNGSQVNQTFTVNYTDGTTNTYTVSLSDWNAPQYFTGETIIVSTSHRNTSAGGQDNDAFDVYGYSLNVNTSKTVESITLPDNKNIAVVAISVAGVITAAPLVTASDNSPSLFTFGSTAVPVDSRVSISSGDSGLSSATVTISPGTFQAGDLLSFNNQNNITGAYDAASGVLTLTGNSSVTDYQEALQSVTFSSTSSSATPRSLTIVARDNLLLSNTATETVNVAPVVTPSGATNTFTIGGSAVVVDAGVTVNANAADLSEATVTISSGTLQAGDTLTFTSPTGSGITDAYSGGVLTLSGLATPAQYQAALQSVMFSTSGTSGNRSLSIAVEDSGAVESNAAAETVAVTT